MVLVARLGEFKLKFNKTILASLTSRRMNWDLLEVEASVGPPTQQQLYKQIPVL